MSPRPFWGHCCASAPGSWNPVVEMPPPSSSREAPGHLSSRGGWRRGPSTHRAPSPLTTTRGSGAAGSSWSHGPASHLCGGRNVDGGAGDRPRSSPAVPWGKGCPGRTPVPAGQPGGAGHGPRLDRPCRPRPVSRTDNPASCLALQWPAAHTLEPSSCFEQGQRKKKKAPSESQFVTSKSMSNTLVKERRIKKAASKRGAISPAPFPTKILKIIFST